MNFRIGKNRRIDMSQSQRGHPGIGRARLQDRDLARIDFPCPQRPLDSSIVGATEAQNADLLADQLLRRFDFRPCDDLQRHAIFKHCDQDHGRAAQRRLNRRGGRVLTHLNAAREQRLHIERAAADEQRFELDAVFLADTGFFVDPKGQLIAGDTAVADLDGDQFGGASDADERQNDNRAAEFLPARSLRSNLWSRNFSCGQSTAATGSYIESSYTMNW